MSLTNTRTVTLRASGHRAISGPDRYHAEPMHRLLAPLLAVALLACTADTAQPEPTLPAGPTAAPNEAAPTAEDYSAAICPVFLSLLGTDPMLASLRAAGTSESSVGRRAAEIDTARAELRSILDGLEAVPEWGPGNLLRHHLTTSVHAIHARLVSVARDPEASAAPAVLATLPYLASAALDEAMASATEAGLDCAGFAE